MDVQSMLRELQAERQQIEEAILVLERIASGQSGSRRGRKPKWMTEAASPAPEPAKRKGRTFTAAQRTAASERMKKRWAAKKKTAKS